MFVSLARAREHLYVIGSDDDAEIAEKLSEAQQIVLDYIGDRDNARGWGEIPLGGTEPMPVPGVVVSALLLVLGALWENREGADGNPDPISNAVRSLLRRYREPPLA